MLEANLNMARQLGLRAVAEGIEDRADWDLLRAIGCESAQGHFFARPMAVGCCLTGAQDRMLAERSCAVPRRPDAAARLACPAAAAGLGAVPPIVCRRSPS